MHTSQNSHCPGCGVTGGDGTLANDTSCNASNYCWELYQKLVLYTFSLGDKDFIHQHVTDIYTAQHSSHKLRNIQTWFSLIGLYLFIEHNYSGKSVQNTHRRLAEKTKDWPQIVHEKPITGMTIFDILSLKSENDRVIAVREWGTVVWQAWREEHKNIIDTYTKVRDHL